MTSGKARVVAGRYRLVRSLGRGGMGAVWQADDELLDRSVAVKEVWFPAAGNEPVAPTDPIVRRALREAQAAARLRHPGIVTVYDVVIEDGRPWIIMELINGQSLADAIREHGLLTEQRTAEIGVQVLEALRAAHRDGITHRDVKPANILLDTDRVVLTDFGIAAIDDATALTATGQMVGSPAYLAPERINGEPATAAGDLWALGVTLYTAVTGQSPFQREDTQSTFAAILNSRPVTPAHAGRLWPVIKGLLVKDPARRLTAEQARPVLAVAAAPASGSDAVAPTARWSLRRPVRPKRSRSTSDGIPPTLNAPPPTIAAPTAYQVPGPAGPTLKPIARRPAGSSMDEPVEAAQATATTPAGSEATVAAETVAASPARNTEAANQGTADLSAATAAETAAYIAAANAANTDTTAQTIGPPAPYPTAGAPVRTARFKPGRLIAAGLTVASLMAAGEAVWILRPGTDNGDLTSSGTSNPSAASAPVAAGLVTTAPPSSAASANPALDTCLVGSWRMISQQVINTNWEGVDEITFSGTIGMSVRIWADGKRIDDYNRSTPMTATIKGAKYAEWLRGVEAMHVETRAGRIFVSEFSGAQKYRITRNGKTVKTAQMSQAVPDRPYICTENRLTVYGNKEISTDAYTRVSHTP